MLHQSVPGNPSRRQSRSRPPHCVSRAPLLLLASALLLHSPAKSATQTWIGGTGTWGTSGDWSGSNWVAGNTAVFGGTAGTVTVGTQTAGGLIFNVGGYTLASGTLTLNTGSVITTNGGTTTFASTLSLAGAGGVALTKTGPGTLALSTSNGSLGTAASPAVWTITGGTYSSSTGLFNSILAIGAGNNLGATPTNATTQVILDAGTLQITGTGLSPAIGANRTIQVNAAGGAIEDSTGNPFQGGITDNAGSGSSLYLSNTSGTSTFSGVISGTGGLTWNGLGTLLLSGVNTYSGGTTINGGIVQFVTDSSLGAAGGTLNLNGGTLASVQTAGVTMTRTIATGTMGGTIQLNNGVPSGANNKITLGTTGQLTGSGPITVTNNGLLSIGAANTGYSGNWTLNGGVVELTNGSAAGTGSITINTGAELSTLGSQITNPLVLGGGSIGWDYYSGSGNYEGPVTLQAAGGNVSLVNFYGTGALSGTISGNITGPGGLSTSDAGPTSTTAGGVLTLSGNNSYTGGTTIGAGTTITAGSSTALGANTGALSVAGTLNLNGNNLNLGALTLAGGDAFDFTLGANTVEKLTVSSASVSGNNDLAFNTANLSGTGTYNLISSASGGLSGGTFDFPGAFNLTVATNTIITETSSGSYYELTLSNTGNAEQLVVSNNVPSKVLTILPFGSSITAGQSAQSPYDGGGYRTQLYQDLVDDGRFNPNFVGSSTALLSNNPTAGNILTTANQLDNEGHPGWTTLMMLANLNMTDGNPGANGGYWLKPGNGENPNYITVNIGGNDAVDYGTSASLMAAASQRLDATVSEFNTLRPGVATILSTIAYRGDNGGTYSINGLDPYYNPAVDGIVFNHVLAGQDVQYLDLRNIISFATDIGPDNIHPTQSGYDKMANAWYQSIIYGAAYWTGSQSNVWSTVNGTSTNFDLDAALTTDRGKSLNDPSTTTDFIYPDVYFSSNTSALYTTLGADTTIRSLNFTKGATGSVTIGAGNTLTIGSVDTSNGSGTNYTLQNSGGITMQAGTGAHTIAANVALGADQTWGNVSSNNLTVSGGISGAHNLTFVGSYTIYNPGTYTPDGTNYTDATFTTTSTTVSGTGGFILSGSDTYTGTTTVGSCTVTLDNAGSTTARLAGTSGIVLNAGGTLLLKSSGGASTDRINNNATLTLAGGTFNTAGLSEGTVSGTTPTQGIGALTLTANSILDLGAGTSVVTFANSSSSTWTNGTVLKIYDWSGNSAGGGTDQVFFGNNASGLTTAQLAQISFYSDAGSSFLGNAGILADGEIVPVPEPATFVGAALLVAIVGYRERRRLYKPR